MLWVVSNSVGRRGEIGKRYTDILNGTFFVDDLILTNVADIWLAFQQRRNELNTEDIFVFNFGINDCIYRKTKSVQLPLFEDIYRRMIGTPYETHFASKLNELNNKTDDTLFTMFTTEQFYNITDTVFGNVSNGIVMSINWFLPTHARTGYAYNEVCMTNNIMKECADKHHLYYLDMFTPHSLTLRDGVHFNSVGHKTVADKIKEIITQRFLSIKK